MKRTLISIITASVAIMVLLPQLVYYLAEPSGECVGVVHVFFTFESVIMGIMITAGYINAAGDLKKYFPFAATVLFAEGLVLITSAVLILLDVTARVAVKAELIAAVLSAVCLLPFWIDIGSDKES